MSNTDTITTDKVGTVGEDTNPNLLITLRPVTFTQSPLLLIVLTSLDTAFLNRSTSVCNTFLHLSSTNFVTSRHNAAFAIPLGLISLLWDRVGCGFSTN